MLEDTSAASDAFPNLVRLKNVGHRFGSGAWLFRNIDTVLSGGKSYALVGPSGSGKSTLLSILAGWQTPAEGSVEHEGGLRLANANVARTNVSWVFQNPFGVATRNARDHVMLPFLARGYTRGEAAAMSEQLLVVLQMNHLADRLYRELSGGEAQRLMIARGIASQPNVLLVDEPTAQLDRTTAVEVNRTVTALADVVRGARTIVVVATHDPDTRDACNEVIDLIHFSPEALSQHEAPTS